MTTLIFVRHGESKSNENGLFTGQTDVALSALGKRQAQALKEHLLRNYTIDRIYASDLKRAYDTVLPFAEAAGLPAWLPAAAGMLAGVGFLAALDGWLPRLRHPRADDAWRQDTLLMTAITLHNVPEGMAVGLAFALASGGEGLAGAAALALGIGIQNFPEGAAIALPLRQEGWPRRRAFAGGMLSGAVEPVFGVLVVGLAAWTQPLMPWLLSFAAGAMLYVVVEELVPQAHSRAGTCGFVTGFLMMMVLDVALG